MDSNNTPPRPAPTTPISKRPGKVTAPVNAPALEVPDELAEGTLVAPRRRAMRSTDVDTLPVPPLPNADDYAWVLGHAEVRIAVAITDAFCALRAIR